jgi:CRISPR-associated protein Csb1
MLLVESAQSMANRLEAVCWDEAGDELQALLKGMPYVQVKLWNGQTTNSILEAHRLNSPYIMNDAAFKEALRLKANVPQRTKTRGQSSNSDDDEVGGAGLLDRRALARAVFFFDPCSILHGVFLVNLDGRVRLQRCISSFIEAKNVRRVDSGGVKNDRVLPGGNTQQGYGNVPFHRTEYVADSITAYFNLDLAQLRAYGLGEAAERFLVSLALWKIRRFLDVGLRLRTACDLELVQDLKVKRLAGFAIPDLAELEQALPSLIQDCYRAGLFSSPPITEVTCNREPPRRARSGAAVAAGTPVREGSSEGDES